MKTILKPNIWTFSVKFRKRQNSDLGNGLIAVDSAGRWQLSCTRLSCWSLDFNINMNTMDMIYDGVINDNIIVKMYLTINLCLLLVLPLNEIK